MITIDVSAAVHSRAGLGRYAERLATAVHAKLPDQVALFSNRGKTAQLPAVLSNITPHHTINAGYKPWRMAVQMANLMHIGFDRLVPDTDIFHSTEHLLFPLKRGATVLTMHDLIFKLFPEYHKKLNYTFLNWAVPTFCERATHIIAVSESSKRDVVAHYGVDPAKITVVYEAASTIFRPPSPQQIAYVRQTYNLPEQFLLHISTIEPRKNLDRLLDAFKQLRQAHSNLHLLLVGAKGWLMDDFFARIEREGLRDHVRPLGWIPDDDLSAIIAAASLAVQPSLYEGFGLPILEEMACGQVVAASNSASHPEVGGDAAVYFSPKNVDEMAAVIGRLLTDREEYEHRKTLSIAQASQFSWERCAAETIEIYNRIAP